MKIGSHLPKLSQK